MATKGFTKIDNLILLDPSLSLEAKALYAILKHLSTIPGFDIRRDHVKSISGYGETAFRRVWKELKDKGLLIETKLRNQGKYFYTYTLTISESTSKVKAPVKKKHVDSDGNDPLDGQVNIDDVLDQEVHEDIKTIAQTIGFTNEESKEILEVAGGDVPKVMECYRYVIAQKNVKNAFNYTKWVISNKINVQESNPVKSTFNNFKHRQYDFKKLERALLYGEPYELPA